MTDRDTLVAPLSTEVPETYTVAAANRLGWIPFDSWGVWVKDNASLPSEFLISKYEETGSQYLVHRSFNFPLNEIKDFSRAMEILDELQHREIEHPVYSTGSLGSREFLERNAVNVRR